MCVYGRVGWDGGDETGNAGQHQMAKGLEDPARGFALIS